MWNLIRCAENLKKYVNDSKVHRRCQCRTNHGSRCLRSNFNYKWKASTATGGCFCWSSGGRGPAAEKRKIVAMRKERGALRAQVHKQYEHLDKYRKSCSNKFIEYRISNLMFSKHICNKCRKKWWRLGLTYTVKLVQKRWQLVQQRLAWSFTVSCVWLLLSMGSAWYMLYNLRVHSFNLSNGTHRA